MHKSNKAGRVPMLMGLLLMTAALLLSGYNYRDSSRAGETAQTVLEELTNALPETLMAPTEPLPGEPKSFDIPEMPTKRVGQQICVAILTVPSLDLTLPIQSGWSYDKLQDAPCLYAGSYFTDDMVICGHNYYTHFGRLRGLPLGAEIYLTTVDGVVYRYTVDNIETVFPTAVEHMVVGDQWDLTLFTCHTGGRTRCAIRCVRERNN